MAGIERVESRDGTSIGCHVGGDGPPLLLVHGTGADHSRWAPVIDRLGERFTTWAMDRRGRGDSADGGGEYSLQDEFGDVAAAVEALGEEVVLVGHSYGAVCALGAVMGGAAPRALVLYEPPFSVGVAMSPPGFVERLEALIAADDREGLVVTFLTEVVRMSPEEVDALRRDPSWGARLGAAHTIPRELRSAETFALDFEAAGAVRVPTLLMHGGESPPFLIEPVRRLHEAIPGSRLVEMPGQAHVAMNTAPDVFLGHLFEFVG